MTFLWSVHWYLILGGNKDYSVELVQPSKSVLYSLKDILLNNLILLKYFKVRCSPRRV